MLTFFRRIRKGLLGEGAIPKYLLYAIGEILLVMIGILLALQINNWNESNKDRDTEQKVLIGLYKNLELNSNQFNGRLRAIEDRNRSSEIIFSVITSSNKDVDTIGRHWQKAIQNIGNLTLSMAGYESLKDVGFQLIIKDSLRNAIIDLYENTYLNLYRSLQWSEEVRPDFDMFMVEHFTREGSGALTPRDFSFIKSNNYFYGLLDVARDQRSFNKSNYENALTETRKIVQLIKEELGQME